jgi:hypothetical protein
MLCASRKRERLRLLWYDARLHFADGSAARHDARIGRFPALVILSLEAIQFGAGSIVDRALLSVVIGTPLRLSAAYLTRAHRFLNAGLGVATVLIGMHLICHIAVVERLLI